MLQCQHEQHPTCHRCNCPVRRQRDQRDTLASIQTQNPLCPVGYGYNLRCLDLPVGVMEVLNRVLTVTEVARMWDKSPEHIRLTIHARYRPLEARKAALQNRGCWLITYESCVRRWGNPPFPQPV